MTRATRLQGCRLRPHCPFGTAFHRPPAAPPALVFAVSQARIAPRVCARVALACCLSVSRSLQPAARAPPTAAGVHGGLVSAAIELAAPRVAGFGPRGRRREGPGSWAAPLGTLPGRGRGLPAPQNGRLGLHAARSGAERARGSSTGPEPAGLCSRRTQLPRARKASAPFAPLPQNSCDIPRVRKFHRKKCRPHRARAPPRRRPPLPLLSQPAPRRDPSPSRSLPPQ
jgi:hypothetical protein